MIKKKKKEKEEDDFSDLQINDTYGFFTYS